MRGTPVTPHEIKRMRLGLGWSQERFAREAGVSFCTVNRWEKGKAAPSPMALRSLKRLLGKSLESKRGSVRLDLRITMVVKGPASEAFASSTENISYGGLMFRTKEKLGADDRLSVELNVEENEPPLRLSAQVVWASGQNGLKKVGIRFDNAKAADMSRLVNTMLTH